MPVYSMMCDSCGAARELYQSIKEPLPVLCFNCGAESLRSVLFPPVILDMTPKTLGTMAERNSDGAGRRYWIEEQRRQHADDKERCRQEMAENLPDGASLPDYKAEKPWWRDTERPNYALNQLTNEQKLNYVMTGDSEGSAPIDISTGTP